MEHMTPADFEQWANLPMTMKVRDHMLNQHAEMRDLTESAMIEQTVYAKGLTPLEALGLEAVMKMSVVRGIELFTDYESLSNSLFSGDESDEA